MIDYWFDLFQEYGVDEVLVNLHHLHEQAERYLAAKSFRGAIHTSYEPELLGSAGTVLANRKFVDTEDCFFILYGDNLTNARLDRWLEFHQKHGDDLTLMLYRTDKPHLKGIVELDPVGKVLSFEEKPTHPRSEIASAGMYIATPAIFDVFPTHKKPLDMAFDILPKLVGRMWGMMTEDVILDIGTPEDYEFAQHQALQFVIGKKNPW